MIPAKKVIPDAKEGYQLSVGVSQYNGRLSCALFNAGRFLAESSDFKDLETVLYQLTSNMRGQNHKPIPNDASIDVLNGRWYLYKSDCFRFCGWLSPSQKIPLSNAEIITKFFTAQDEQKRGAYVDWKLLGF